MSLLKRREYIISEYNKIKEAKDQGYNEYEIDGAYEIAWQRKASSFCKFDLQEARDEINNKFRE